MDNNAGFKVGDVVMLKSGGPVMTVLAVEGDDVDCDWFAGSTRHTERFAPLSLKHVEGVGQPSIASNPPRGW